MKQKVEVIPFLSHMGEFCSPLKPNSESILTRVSAPDRLEIAEAPKGRRGSREPQCDKIKCYRCSWVLYQHYHCSACQLPLGLKLTHTPILTISKSTRLPPTCTLLPVHTFLAQRDQRDMHLSSDPEADLTFLDTVSS